MTENEQHLLDLITQMLSRIDHLSEQLEELQSLSERVSALERDRSKKLAPMYAAIATLAPGVEAVIRHHFHF